MKNWSVVLSGWGSDLPAANRLLKHWKDNYCLLYTALYEYTRNSHPASMHTLMYDWLTSYWTRARTLLFASIHTVSTWVQTCTLHTFTHSSVHFHTLWLHCNARTLTPISHTHCHFNTCGVDLMVAVCDREKDRKRANNTQQLCQPWTIVYQWVSGSCWFSLLPSNLGLIYTSYRTVKAVNYTVES